MQSAFAITMRGSWEKINTCMCTHAGSMGTKNISIKSEAYERLKSLKGKVRASATSS